MNDKLDALLDSLSALLSEANVVLGIQHRAAEVGISVDRTFVEARLARWHNAVREVQVNVQRFRRLEGLSVASTLPVFQQRP